MEWDGGRSVTGRRHTMGNPQSGVGVSTGWRGKNNTTTTGEAGGNVGGSPGAAKTNMCHTSTILQGPWKDAPLRSNCSSRHWSIYAPKQGTINTEGPHYPG
eukprot:582144-Ditylum_brightwellii.AAC.1